MPENDRDKIIIIRQLPGLVDDSTCIKVTSDDERKKDHLKVDIQKDAQQSLGLTT